MFRSGKDARPIERFGDVVAHPILGGLHHLYARIEISEATRRKCIALSRIIGEHDKLGVPT
jgi:hypothetical protein